MYLKEIQLRLLMALGLLLLKYDQLHLLKGYSNILRRIIFYGSKYNSNISYKISKEGYYTSFRKDEQESTLITEPYEYIGLIMVLAVLDY